MASAQQDQAMGAKLPHLDCCCNKTEETQNDDDHIRKHSIYLSPSACLRASIIF